MRPLFSILISSLFLNACTHPALTPVPTPPLKHVIGIVALADPNTRIAGATVQLHEFTGPTGYVSQVTNNIGFTEFVVDSGLLDSDVIIDATGYNTFYSHVDVVDRANYFYTLTPTKPPLPQPAAQPPLVLEGNDPSGLICHTTQLPNLVIPAIPNQHFWRGDAWGVTIPGLPFVNGGSSKHPERALTWFFDRWSSDWQQSILNTYRLRGYTHFTLSWPDSRDGNGQSITQFVVTAQTVNAAIPYVPVFLTSKLYDSGKTVAQHLADVTPVIDALRAANIPAIYVVGWELDSFFSGNDLETFSAALMRRYPDADWYWHFTTYKTSWQPDGQPRAQFWQFLSQQPHMGSIGLLYQGNQNDPCGLMQAHFNDAMVPASGLQAASALLVPWELVAANEFDGDHPNEDDANARSWEVMNTPGAITSSGFGEGARYPNGDPTLVQY